ncbi:MAG: C39 family peptidase [Anaerolineales bacterium]|nr:C39 family peptidase [Anaerolineales bacterium]
MRRSLILAAAILAACLLLVPDAQAGCVPGEGECPLEPPQSEEVNPDPGGSTSLLAGEVAHPGSAMPVVLAMPLPRVVPARAVQGVKPPAPVVALPVPMRYQDPADGGDVSCGVEALGMALDGLGGAAPTSGAITDLLQRAGMLYSFGTGVEELAFAAQAYGYAGSLALHGGTLDDLRAQLDLGRPVVVGLGTNGAGQPGHFVTVTGISADGAWVIVNDPSVGPRTLPTAEFLRLWDLQGNSGVVVAQEPPAAPNGSTADPMPWVALMAGVMALVSTTPWGARRPGVGGRVDSGGGGKKAAPAPKPVPKPAPAPAPKPASAPAPKARFDEESPAPAPRPATAPVPAPKPAPVASSPAPKQELAKTSPPPAPRVRFDEDPPAPLVVPPNRFDTEPDPPPKVTKTPTVTPTPVASATPAPTENATVSRARFDEEVEPPRVVSPTRSVGGTPESTVTPGPPPTPTPKRAVGTPTATPPVLASSPGPRFDGEDVVANPAPSTPRAMVTPMPKPPEGYDPADITPLAITAADVIRWDARALRVVRAVDRAQNAAVMAETTSSSLLRSAFTKFSLGISGLVAVGTNLYDYGLGEHRNEGVGSQQFWVSTGVDFGTSVFVGSGSAVAVAGVSVIVVALGGAAIAAPYLLVGAAVMGLVTSIALEIMGTPEEWKSDVNDFVDEREDELDRLSAAPELVVAPKSGMPVR